MSKVWVIDCRKVAPLAKIGHTLVNLKVLKLNCLVFQLLRGFLGIAWWTRLAHTTGWYFPIEGAGGANLSPQHSGAAIRSLHRSGFVELASHPMRDLS